MHTIDYFSLNNLKTDLKKKAIRGAGVTFLSKILTQAIQVIATVILARLLTPSDFGLVAMVTVITMILVEFGMLRLTEAVIQKENINHRQISTLFWINVLLCLLLTIALIVLAPLIAWFYHEPRITKITIVLSFAFIFSGLSNQHLALLQRNLQFFHLMLIEIIAMGVSVILAIILAIYNFGYWALIARYLSLPFVMFIGAWAFCRWRPGLPTRDADIIPMLKFGINSLGNYSLNYLTRSIDKLLIGWRFGSDSLGNYDRAYHLFVLPINQLTYPLTSVAVATLSRLKDEPEKYKDYYLKALSLLAFVGMAISAILTLTGQDLIILLLGQKWHEAGRIFSVFGPGIGLMLIYGTHGWLHLSLGRADRWFRWGLLATIVIISFFIIGAFWGAIGIASAYVISFYVLFIPGMWYAVQPIKLSILAILENVWKYFTSALIAGLLCRFIIIYAHWNIKIIVLNILSTTILFLSLYLIFVMLFYRSFQPIIQPLSYLKNFVPDKKQK